MKKQAWLILCIITLIAGLALAVANMITAGPIEEQRVKAIHKARISVFPDASDFIEISTEDATGLDSIYEAKSDSDTIGYVLQTTVSGYAGPIEIIIGVDTKGTITGLSVGGSNFAETAGLGTKVKEPAFTGQFAGLAEMPTLNGNVDTISGATISSSAVINGVIKCYRQWEAIAGVESTTASAELFATGLLHEDGVFIGVADGFVAPIKVSVTVENGIITEIKVLDESDTNTIFAMALDGILPAVIIANGIDGVDTVSGATYSSQGLLDAISNALCATCSETPSDQAVQTQYSDGVLRGEAQGYMGKIKVSVTVESGAITAVKVLDQSDTDAIFAMARDSILPAVMETNGAQGVDTVSGATYSSQGLLDAISNALNSTSAEAEADADDVRNDGIFIGEAQGYLDKIKVSITVEDGAITAIKVLDHDDTDAIFAMAREGILPAVIAVNSTDSVDTVSGATYSSQGLLDAIKDALLNVYAEVAPTGASSDVRHDGIFEGIAQGYTGKVKVAVTVEGGNITDVKVLDQSDTDAIFAIAKEAIVPVVISTNTVDGIDTATGATYSSQGLLDAIADALNKPVPVEYHYTDGIYKGEAKGYHGSIKVSVTVANSAIVEVDILESGDSPSIIAMVKDALLPMVLKNNSTSGLDAIADATYSSQGLLDAVAEALSKATAE